MENTIKSDILEARKASEVDDFIDKHVLEPIAMVFSHLFIMLGLTPNMVTILSLIVGVIGGFLFYSQNFALNLLGIFLYFISAVFDTSDGQVARLTNHKSPVGRFLDGFCDTIVASSSYIALGLKLMKTNIPFTSIQFGYWIWIIVFYCGLFAHRKQCMMADYYRNLHLFFLKNKNGSELDRSKNIKVNDNDSFIMRFYHSSYKRYTANQEKNSPKLQILLNKIEENGNTVPKEMRTMFLNASSKYIKYTALLTFNLRTIALFVGVLFNLNFYFFVFVITVMEIMRIIMTRGYEEIAYLLYQKFYENDGVNK